MVSPVQIRSTIGGIRDESKNGGGKRDDGNINGGMRDNNSSAAAWFAYMTGGTRGILKLVA